MFVVAHAGGSWLESCTNATFSNGMLTAVCQFQKQVCQASGELIMDQQSDMHAQTNVHGMRKLGLILFVLTGNVIDYITSILSH